MTTEQVVLSDVTLDCIVEGPSDGPLALLLHGFPDTRDTFRHLTPALVERGYRVVVPAMRGYAPSTPSSINDYQVAALASDALELEARYGGGGNSVLIGHDWGSIAAEMALKAAPTRWRRAVMIAVPPAALFASLFTNYGQLRASWYMFFFQNPLADFVVTLDDMEFISRLWSDWSPGYDALEDVDGVRRALGDPEHMTAALGYYRTTFGTLPTLDTHPEIIAAQSESPTVPTLYLHGSTDGCAPLAHIGDPLPYLAPGSRFEAIDGAGHFLQLEAPDKVNALIAEWLAL